MVAVGRSEKGGIRGYPWSVQITIRATRSERRSGKKNAVKIEYAIGMETRIITSSTVQKGRGSKRLEMEMGDGDWGVVLWGEGVAVERFWMVRMEERGGVNWQIQVDQGTPPTSRLP